MTPSQSSNTTGSLNRRTLVKGAAWSSPAIAAAAAVPAYASSIDSEIPTVKYGVFTQAFNSNPSNDFDTRFGLDSYTVQVANASATSSTPQSSGGGTFTPAVASVRVCTVARACGSPRPLTPRVSTRAKPTCRVAQPCG